MEKEQFTAAKAKRVYGNISSPTLLHNSSNMSIHLTFIENKLTYKEFCTKCIQNTELTANVNGGCIELHYNAFKLYSVKIRFG